MNTISIKLDLPLEKTLLKLSQRERVSKSELVRRALQAYAAQKIHEAPAQSALEKAGDLVGCFKGAPKDLASNPAHMADYGRV
jgi:metal-responsive CopG/Arc/MetJ family transcriptional regulator